jgi:hypothetical protein
MKRSSLIFLLLSAAVVDVNADTETDNLEADKPDAEPVKTLSSDEIQEAVKHEEMMEALTYTAPKETRIPIGLQDKDVMSHIHSLPVEEEEALLGGYIFDVDDANRNPTQRCYVRNQEADHTKMPDNIENSVIDAQEQLNEDGTNRAQWAKCLPPPMYTLLSVESFAEGDIYNGRYEKRMRNATDFYATLKWLHNEACAHIRIRLENKVMLSNIREEVNYRARLGIGFKIKQALNPIIEKIVEQYRETNNMKVNPANTKVRKLLEESLPSIQKALQAAKHASMSTLENGMGAAGATTANDLLKPLYGSVMNFNMDKFDKYMKLRPGPLDDMLAGSAKRGLGANLPGSDKIPDALKNFGRCGKPLFDFAGYGLYTITVSQNERGECTILTRDGWKLPKQVTSLASDMPIRAVLPPDAYEVETKTTSYQDDLFASGNLACGDRADGLWTLTSYDRNSNENKVTATQEEGYFCVWMLNDLLVLPENQRAGFSNTEFVAESPQEMARVMNGDVENYKKYFPKPGEKYKYYHCHYSPRNSGSARVHSFQHQAERHYPGGIRQYCNCDWRRMGMIVSRCDCTLDAKANGGCRRVEMEMLNEHTQFDLWRKDGNQKVPSRVSMVHGDLAEGKIKSYTYQNDRRRRQPDNRNIYQEDTGRVRPTTNGNGGNNVVCSVNDQGNADNAAVRSFNRRTDKQIVAKSTIDPTADQNCRTQNGMLNQHVYYFTQGTSMQNLDGKPVSRISKVPRINFANNNAQSAPNFAGRTTDFAVRWWGELTIQQTNNYYFRLNCDDGCRMYLNNQLRQNNDHYGSYRNHNARIYLAANPYTLKIEYFQRNAGGGIEFRIFDSSNRVEQDYTKMFSATCSQKKGDLTRSFFVDLNGDGKYNPATNTAPAKEFVLRDIYAPTQGAAGRRRNAASSVSSPAGGVNFEFVDSKGDACDVLKLKAECKPADAGKLYQRHLADYLAKFCDVPAALYQVPVNSSGLVPEEFGAVTTPMPFRGYGEKWTNYRAQARADMAHLGHGTTLFCQENDKDCRGNKPLAVQGLFYGLEDERVQSAKGSVLQSKFYPQMGGSTNGNVPSAVNTKWTQAGTAASGLFNQDILTKYRQSTNPGSIYAKNRVQSDSTRGEGVTCLNGKYVYARKEADGSRPIVSTVREGLNRNGPVANNQWACRYMGVHCNANNCNNNGNAEVPGPFVQPLIKKKSVVTTTTTTTTQKSAGRRRRRNNRRRSRRRKAQTSGAASVDRRRTRRRRTD